MRKPQKCVRTRAVGKQADSGARGRDAGGGQGEAETVACPLLNLSDPLQAQPPGGISGRPGLLTGPGRQGVAACWR